VTACGAPDPSGGGSCTSNDARAAAPRR
jgi:hypothetical protein